MIVKSDESLFDEIFEPYSASICKEVSRKERDRKRSNSRSFAYGEIDFLYFAIIIRKV